MITKKDYEKMKEEMIYYKRRSEEFLLEIIKLNQNAISTKEVKGCGKEFTYYVERDFGFNGKKKCPNKVGEKRW